MDEIIITAAVILSVIAIIEVVTLFFSVSKDIAPAYVTVLPVFGNDTRFEQRLEYLMQKGCGRHNIIFVDYSASCRQQELCGNFVRNNPDAIFISHIELESFFSEIFSADAPEKIAGKK